VILIPRAGRIIRSVTSAVLGLPGTRRKLPGLNIRGRRIDIEHDPVDIRRDRRGGVINYKGERFCAGWCA
jgi:hypothetical protein